MARRVGLLREEAALSPCLCHSCHGEMPYEAYGETQVMLLLLILGTLQVLAILGNWVLLQLGVNGSKASQSFPA